MKSIKQVLNGTSNPAIARITPNMTFLSKMTCECGEDVDVYEMVIPFGPRKGEKIEAKFGCKCEDIKLAEKALRTRQRAKLRKMQEVFDRHSLINKQLQQANLENYEPGNPSQEKAKRIAARFVEIFDTDQPRNLLFFGTYGVGKSHLAKAITDGVMAKGYSAIFISVPKLLTRFRTSYNKNSEYSEGDLIEALNVVDLLVLDDLGAEKDSGWTDEKLFEIIDSRQGMHTVYTSNFTPEDLISKLGERNFGRVVNQDTTLVEIEGKNFRLEKFAQEG